ncbi:MAG: phosphate ABC transporter substrate-binding protein, partial [Nitrosopumilus sp.]|nr:phosphate ABC transporter substrate-binding protein [Nitrosopumilus sp.]
PSWIKNNAGLWSNDAIDDETFVNGIEYLVQTGVIQIN